MTTTMTRTIHAIKKAINFVVRPPPSKEAIDAREGADRVIAASCDFTEKQDVIWQLLRDMPSPRGPRQNGKKKP